MKHRSPLITLAAVTLAFIIMFTVDVLAGPPGGNSAQPAVTSAPPAPASAASPSPQPSKTAAVTPSAIASKSSEESKFPKKVVYAGHAEGRRAHLPLRCSATSQQHIFVTAAASSPGCEAM